MTKRPKSYEPPLHLDMDFEEALKRFAQTDKKEADELAAKAKSKKKPPGPKAPTTKHRQKVTPSSRSKSTDGD